MCAACRQRQQIYDRCQVDKSRIDGAICANMRTHTHTHERTE